MSTPPSLKILIIGAGIAGLTTAIALAEKGHTVAIYEASQKRIPGIGAGISLYPNCACILDQLGLWKECLKRAGAANFPRFQRRWTGELIAQHGASSTEGDYGYPVVIIHRADLIEVLDNRVREMGIEVHLGSPVSSIEESTSAVTLTLADGSTVSGDVVVGADGIKSVARSYVLNDGKEEGLSLPSLTGTLTVYRHAIPGQVVRDDPQTAHLMEGNNWWVGPGCVAVSTPLRNGTEYGLEIAHGDEEDIDGDEEGNVKTKPRIGHWGTRADMDQVREMHKDWDPAVKRVLELADSCLVWRVLETGPLKTWIGAGGRVVIVGDAAHAMKQYAGQGGAMGIEDAACLAECLDPAYTGLFTIPDLLLVFENMRKPRVELVSLRSNENATLFHLRDGPEQQARDARWRAAPIWKASDDWDRKPIDELPNGVNDPKFMVWLLGADVVSQTRRELQSKRPDL